MASDWFLKTMMMDAIALVCLRLTLIEVHMTDVTCSFSARRCSFPPKPPPNHAMTTEDCLFFERVVRLSIFTCSVLADKKALGALVRVHTAETVVMYASDARIEVIGPGNTREYQESGRWRETSCVNHEKRWCNCKMCCARSLEVDGFR